MIYSKIITPLLIFFLGIHILKKKEVEKKKISILPLALFFLGVFSYKIMLSPDLMKNKFMLVNYGKIFGGILLFLFITKETYQKSYKLFYLLLWANAVIIPIEMFLAYFNHHFLGGELATELSHFLAVKGQSAHIVRNLGQGFILYRPQGLMGNIHNSAICLVFLTAIELYHYKYLTQRNQKDFIKVLIKVLFLSSILLFTNNLQSSFCFFLLILHHIQISKKNFLLMACSFLAIMIYISTTHEIFSFLKGENRDSGSMWAILMNSLAPFYEMSLSEILLGAHAQKILQLRVYYGAVISDSGIIYNTLHYGLIGLASYFFFLFKMAHELKTKETRSYFLGTFLALSVSIIHYFNLFSIVGLLFSVLFFSHLKYSESSKLTPLL